MANRRKEKPGAPITKPDSLGIAIGATSLCEVLNQLTVEVNKQGKITFNFTILADGVTDYKTETLKFVFKNDTTLATTDENGKKNDLNILKASTNELSFSVYPLPETCSCVFKKKITNGLNEKSSGKPEDLSLSFIGNSI